MQKKILTLTIAIWVFAGVAGGQIFPRPDADLNFTQIMFEHPAVKGAEKYVLEIALDTGAAFGRSTLQISDSLTATMVSGLQIGKSYVWRYCAYVHGKRTAWCGPYRFNILDKYNFEKGKNGLRVIENDSLKNAGGLIAIDALHAIFDRQGQVVWFMALPGNLEHNKIHTEDLRITKSGTITYLDNELGRECDLMLRNLWVSKVQAVNQFQKKFGPIFNHDIKCLPGGNYMIIQQDCNWEKLPEQFNYNNAAHLPYDLNKTPVAIAEGYKIFALNSGNLMRVDSTGSYMFVNTGAVTEYDKEDSVIWQWKAGSYLAPEDIFVDNWTPDSPMINHDPHMNGFSIDEKNEYVYVSFRNLSRLVKVERKTGSVVNSWGDALPSAEARGGHNFFHKQHGPCIMSDNNLMVFNNDFKNVENRPPGIVIFSQGSAAHPAEILWKYDCLFDSAGKANYDSRGGNADILPNNNLLVCMGQVNRVFEIDRDKKISWNALVETLNADSAWVPLPLYRAHYSSSLYPCYFTIETDNDTLSANQTSFQLKICNAGSENDSYSVTVSSSANSYQLKLSSGELAKRRSAAFNIAALKKPVSGEKIWVIVKSDTNQHLVKKLQLVYR